MLSLNGHIDHELVAIAGCEQLFDKINTCM